MLNKLSKCRYIMIELKRRDNANIVKVMCSGIIDQILNKHSAEGAYEFTRETLHKIITGKFKMDKFIITKTLKGNSLTKEERKLEKAKPKEQRTYVDRTRIVHAVLADRMADRDPGNKPLSNDRIPYAYVETKGKVELQGDRVDNPEYIVENKLKLDYLFYITNQIKTPALKFLDLLIENAEDIFREFEIKEENRKHGMMPISYYAEKCNNTDSDNLENFDSDFDESKSNSKVDYSDSDDEKPKKVVKKSKIKHNKQDDDFVNFDNLECIEPAITKPKTKKINNDDKAKFIDKYTDNQISNITSGDLLGELDTNDNSVMPSRLKNKGSKLSKPIKKSRPITTVANSISAFDLMDN